MTSSGPAERDDYCLEVESHFAARRGTPFIFSAKDWILLQQWRDSGIPLPIVLEAIDQCFDKREKAGRKRTISSLHYCRHAVKELWEERQELLVGAGGEVPEMDPASRIREIADEIETSASTLDELLKRELQGTAERLRALPAGRSVPQLEDDLLQLEQELMERLIAALPVEQREELERVVDADLKGYRSADEKVLQKTRRANLLRLLRRRLSLPRLSLFT